MQTQANTAKPLKTKQKWPPVRKHFVGSSTYWLVDLGKINGKRTRQVFKTRTEADTCAEQARIKRKNEGIAAFSLSEGMRVEAARCLEDLKPHGATLTEAVKYYVKHVLAFRTAPSVAEVIIQLIEAVKSKGRRKDTIADLEYRLGRFGRNFGNRQLASITKEELEEWLKDPSLSPRSRINFSVKVSQLFNFAISKNWAATNPMEKVTRPDPEDDEEPGILTVKQASDLLEHAGEFELVPYIALGLFAGLRSAELMRLDWSAIKIVDRSIIVGAKIAKKRSRRVVEIADNLVEWLTPHVKGFGPVVDPENFRKRMFALREAAGISEWPSNCLRHSFGSYHLARFGDAVKTAAQMGHQDVGILHNHYKALVLKSEAERYWELRPLAVANVISLQQVGKTY